MKTPGGIAKFRAWAQAERGPSEVLRLHEARLASVALARVMAQHPKGAVLAVTADAAAAEALWGDRARTSYAWKTLLAAGVHLGGGYFLLHTYCLFFDYVSKGTTFFRLLQHLPPSL